MMGNKGTPLWKALLLEHRIPWRYLAKLNNIQIKMIDKKEYFCFNMISAGLGDLLYISPIAQKIQSMGVKTLCAVHPNHKDIIKRIKGFDKIIPLYIEDFEEKYKNSFYNDFMLTGSGFPEGKSSIIMKFWKKFGERFNERSDDKIDLAKEIDKKVGFNLIEEEEEYAKSFKEKNEEYIVMHTDCSVFGPRRSWFNESWQKLIDMQKLPVIVVGKSDNELKNCIDLRNKTNVFKTAALIKYCRLYVSIDSGPLAFTNAFEKDAIVINGGYALPSMTKHAKSRHFYSNIECAPCMTPYEKCPHDMKCMKIITPEKVNKEIIEVLKN